MLMQNEPPLQAFLNLAEFSGCPTDENFAKIISCLQNKDSKLIGKQLIDYLKILLPTLTFLYYT